MYCNWTAWWSLFSREGGGYWIPQIILGLMDGIRGWNLLLFQYFTSFYTFLWPNYVRLWRLAIQVWGWLIDSIHPCFAIWIPLCMWATDLHVNVSIFVTGIEGVDIHQVDTTGSWVCCFGKDINSTRYVINSFFVGFSDYQANPEKQ